MTEPMRGIHHITAIASDPQSNLDFYTQVLGLRLVKLTVNFDDPGTYHFYFGDEAGRPGTILTFFPWVNSRRGQRGIGQVGAVAYTIPAESTGFWQERFKRLGISISTPFQRFDEEVLTVLDSDSMPVELVAREGARAEPHWSGGPVPEEHAIRGFDSPTFLLEGFERTAALLTETFGLRQVQQSGQRYRFSTGGNGAGSQVDIEVRPNEMFGQMGAGIVHHIAWRASDDQQQADWREILVRQGYNVTPVLDRQYFHSIYFREPGGILFEIATDPPGFSLDEAPESLGTQLKLPDWLEPRRASIERLLPQLKLPVSTEQ
jgi:glyoxalase family protein